MVDTIIGIDPGIAGGIVALASDGKVKNYSRMPDTPMDILEYLNKLSNGMVVCYMEDVGRGMPGQSSSATAKFARHNGNLEAFLMALMIPTVMVTPQKWQKIYQLGKSSEYSKTEWKKKLKSKAQQLFPMQAKNISLSTSDAFLIAEYGRRMECCQHT